MIIHFSFMQESCQIHKIVNFILIWVNILYALVDYCGKVIVHDKVITENKK
jgi:hypothetical protein